MRFVLTIYENGYTRIETYDNIRCFWLDAYGVFDARTTDGKRILIYGVQNLHSIDERENG